MRLRLRAKPDEIDQPHPLEAVVQLLEQTTHQAGLILPIVIQPYESQHEAAVEEFNCRLQSQGAEPDLVFYPWAQPRWLPPGQNKRLFNKFFLALDGVTVRGGYALKHQNFTFPDGTIRSIGYYHHPLSEGIVNKSYAIVGTLLLRDAMQRSPLLYCLGMGGYDRPLPQMLVRLGWSHHLLPFYFRIVHPYRFLKEMQALRQSRWHRWFMDLAANTGTGWMALKVLGGIAELKAPRTAPYALTEVEEFSGWADALWEQSKGSYAFTAVRDSETLRALYPTDDKHFSRLRVSRKGTDIGWAVVGERRQEAKYGALRVGSLVDCWASLEDAVPVVQVATQKLEQQGLDLIVSNQSHPSWGRALKATGFLAGPSNFIFAGSQKLAQLLQPFEKTQFQMHFTRADGDGLPRNF